MEEKLETLIERVAELENENAEMKKWQAGVNELLKKMFDMVTQKADNGSGGEELNRLWEYAMINRYRIDSLPYEMMDPDYESFYFKPKILSKDKTIEKIINEHKSIARLGDGEFAAIVGQKRWNFQGVSEVLSVKMKEVLASNDKKLLIGLNPYFYMNLSDIPEKDADAARAYMRPMVRKLHAQLLSPNKIYGNALFHGIECDEDVKNLKRLWNGRDCIFVEGVYTRMGVGNELFDNCRSIERILCPAENAIDRYDDIMKETLKQPVEKLILLALGPTATVLAYDLCRQGYQAVDIGHIDLIYESYLRGAQDYNYVNIPYKYCKANEWKEGIKIEDVDDPEYHRQIIAKII